MARPLTGDGLASVAVDQAVREPVDVFDEGPGSWRGFVEYLGRAHRSIVAER